MIINQINMFFQYLILFGSVFDQTPVVSVAVKQMIECIPHGPEDFNLSFKPISTSDISISSERQKNWKPAGPDNLDP